MAEGEEAGAVARWGLVAVIGLGAVPGLLSPYALVLASHALVLGIACTGVNLLLGYGGLLSLGHAAYFGLGAYTGGFLRLFAGWGSLEGYLFSGVLASTLLAAFVGALCVRATRIYFTVLTLAFAQTVHSLFIAGIVFRLAGDVGTGLFFVGEGGLYLPRLTLAGLDVAPERFPTVLYYLIAACFLGSTMLMWRIVSSPFGKVLQAIRDNETRAWCIGIRVRLHRWTAFVISGGFAGLAGGLAGELDRQVTPEQLHWLFSTQLILTIVLGGTRQFWGPVVGAFAFGILEDLSLRGIEYRGIVLGVLLITIVFAFPGGVVGSAARVLAKFSRAARA